MTRNHLAAMKIPSARRGSKKDWPLWAGQVSPELHDALMQLLGPRHRGDLVAEALLQYAKRRKRAA